jgi:LPXTG-site transpeptidase (sortase) family protein
MINNSKLIKKTPFLGCLPQASFLSLGVWLLALAIGSFFGGPNMALSERNSTIFFLILLAIFLFFYFWAVFSLTPRRLGGELALGGIYQYVRHPMYASTIFILLPALAIFLRSWALMLVCLPVYFIWRSCIKDEEGKLVDVFGNEYLKYRKNTWPFFPNLLKVSKPMFFGLTALAVFIIAFVGLNFQSFYLRSVEWKQDEPPANVKNLISQKTVAKNGQALPQSQPARPKPVYDKPNSIVLYKINIEAPLVFASGTSQKELNAALNQGVLVYPGSKLPGERGNIFLSGHSSAYPWAHTKYAQVFTLLDKLETGDIVTIYFNKNKYDYEVIKKYVTMPENLKLDTSDQGKNLTLSTCWPIGTAWKRLVVEGILITSY